MSAQPCRLGFLATISAETLSEGLRRQPSDAVLQPGKPELSHPFDCRVSMGVRKKMACRKV